MKPKNALKKLEPLFRAPSFTSKEASKRGVSSATLAYYVNQNELIRIGHGVYRTAHVPMVDDFRWEELAEAVQRAKDGVICLTSALYFYHLTEEMPSQYWIAIRHGTVHRVAPPVKVVRMRNLNLGKTTIKIGNIKLPIFDRERTIVDAFRYLGRETALKALKAALTKKGAERIDIEKIRKYAKKLRVKIEPFLIAMTI
ncbi:MAG TPA: type IV toxin-antitoxin system AbiEi family antitoxin domain-containing protein [Candidatus Babeliales bacterium]|jgi:predicted transcriptional regulator of viral defense system|nr:type IV toxin-antitoxin system AbiEi family antitoxin domain-containing protein [Candidatus Babeliales bacterium]